MSRNNALFINGVFESVLDEIVKIQSVLPDYPMFLQPHTNSVMVKLRDDPPTLESPMQLFLSTTTQLSQIVYQAEIIGWEDKRLLSPAKHEVLDRIIRELQEGEGGLYNAAKSGTGESVNLLTIRRLRRLAEEPSVAELRKISDGEFMSTGRTTAGGWAYVYPVHL
jgi:5-methylcytosine-specific restriction enzyme A